MKKCIHYMIRQCGSNEYQCEEDSCLKIFKVKLEEKK